MKIDPENSAIYIKPGFTDMRKQINGLSEIAAAELNLDPFSGSLFLFCGQTRKVLKILYWDRNGFCLWSKRLERDVFPWPKNKQEAQQISREQLVMLLDGIDFWKAHKELKYRELF